MILIEDTNNHAIIPTDAERDILVMGWEDRRRTRQRVHTAKGRECAIALPTGTVLRDGQVLYVASDFYISVEADLEDVLCMPLLDPSSAAGLGYEMGNRHLPVSISSNGLATPYHHHLEQMLAKSGVPFQRRKEKFEPVRVLHHHG